jgi:hypothetical protein
VKKLFKEIWFYLLVAVILIFSTYFLVDQKYIIEDKDSKISQLEKQIESLQREIQEQTTIECGLYWIKKYTEEDKDFKQLYSLRNIERIENDEEGE